MSMFTRVGDRLRWASLLEHCIYLDTKKTQESSTANNDDEGDDGDLPRIELDEMLADMTMEDPTAMDA